MRGREEQQSKGTRNRWWERGMDAGRKGERGRMERKRKGVRGGGREVGRN